MSSARTRVLAGVAAWAAAVGAALVVGPTAVGAIGVGLLGPGQPPLTPAQGFRVQTEDDGGGPRVRFRTGHARFEVNVRCVDGHPVGDVETDD